MADNYDKDLKKFETDILVKRIMDRKWYETQALVAATKEHSVNPRIDIIKRKRELLKLFLTEREEVDNKKIEEYREKIFLKKLTAIQIENEQVNKIIPEEDIEVKPLDVYVEEIDIDGHINDEENPIIKNAKGKEEFEIIKDEEEERKIRIIEKEKQIRKEEEERKRKVQEREAQIIKEEAERKKQIEEREKQIIEEKKQREEEYKRKIETEELMKKVRSNVDINLYMARMNESKAVEKSKAQEAPKERTSIFERFRDTVSNTLNLFKRKKVIDAYENQQKAQDEYNRAIYLEREKKKAEKEALKEAMERKESRNQKLEKSFGSSFWGIINHKQAQKKAEEENEPKARFEPRTH